MKNLGRLAAMVAVATASVALAGCSSSAHSAAQQQPDLVANKVTSPPPSAAGERCSADDIEVSGTFNTPPKVTIPDGCAPPDRTVFNDIIPGTGAEVQPDKSARVNFVVIDFATGKVVDSSYRKGEPVTVPDVGSASVLRSWNEEIIGAKEKGRRLLVLPPSPEAGQPQLPQVTPNMTLVMVVDILDVTG